VEGLRRRAVFLDRDGTLNVRPPEHEYLVTSNAFVWLPGACEALARLHRAGYVLAVASNQRGIALGLVSPSVLRQIERRIQSDLAAFRCRIEAFRYCVHDSADACECRKPRPGMLLDLAREIDVDLSRSWMVGDTESDVAAGRAAGCRTALIGSTSAAVGADLVAPSLDQVSRRIARPKNIATAL
jgi:D-glycero-D-manno-heptose 1,7-bisphosphate phosphatase